MQNSEKHLKTELVVDKKKLFKLICSPHFHSLTTLTDGVWEVSSKLKTVKIKNLLQIAFFVYASAKVIMLEFVFNFIDRYFPRGSYELGHTDTDSMYLAWAKTPTGNFEDLVKPDLRRDYFENKGRFLQSEVCQQASCRQQYVNARTNKLPWVQPECCAKVELFDKRTPGLFKTEFQGSEVCFLNPKTYCITGDDEDKIACKGVIKRLNPLKMAHFKRVLFDVGDRGNTHFTKNASFRMVDGKMRTAVVYKNGFTGQFIKRKVLSDRIHTEPLDL